MRYLEHELKKSYFHLIWLALFLLFFQSLFFLGQSILINNVIITPKIVKVILFLLFLLVIFVHLILYRWVYFSEIIIILLYAIFLATNLLSIVINDVGSQSFQVFLYNYSLSIILIPITFIILSRFAVDDGRSSIAWEPNYIFISLVFIILGIAFVEWYLQKSIFTAQFDILSKDEIIKFDSINDANRLNSIFRSPIDFSYINVIFATLFFVLFIKTKRKAYGFLLILMSFLALIIKVRSGIVFMAVSYTVVVIYLLSVRNVIRILFIFLVSTSLLIYLGGDLLDKITDPTNLIIRLNNWSNLIDELDTLQKLFFGLGIVQNGSYGLYHSKVIDNLYVGIVLTGGVLGLFLFLMIVALLFFQIHVSLKSTNKIWAVSVLSGFLGAGLFENVMHIFYFGILPILFVFLNKLSFHINEDCK